MKIVIEGTPEECKDIVRRLHESYTLPTPHLCLHMKPFGECAACGSCTHGVLMIEGCLLCGRVGYMQSIPDAPCPHTRPSWRMCPHCNGVNDAARVTLPAFPPAPPVGELVYPPTSTSEPIASVELPKSVWAPPGPTVRVPGRIDTVEMNITRVSPIAPCKTCGGKTFTADGPCLECAVQVKG